MPSFRDKIKLEKTKKKQMESAIKKAKSGQTLREQKVEWYTDRNLPGNDR